MNLILFLLRASWPIVGLAGLVGAASGAASVGLVALILRALREPDGSSLAAMGLFAGLCAVVLVTRIVSQLLLSRLTQNTISKLRLGLCRRILDSSLGQLEQIGSHKLQGVLTGDVNVVAGAMNGVPGLAVNAVILVFGAVYLGSLSPVLLGGCLVFAALGVVSYLVSDRGVRVHVRRAREAQDDLLKHLRELLEGIKELKMHHDRRLDFVGRVAECEARVRERQYVADCLNDAAISWGRVLFFVAIGLLLFAWPRLARVDPGTLTGYALTILYLSSPLEQIIGWLPFLGWASGSVGQIERLGLMLEEKDAEPAPAAPERPVHAPSAGCPGRIELCGVTYAYRAEGQPRGFTLGPIDLALEPGEIVFVIGGNGSGKTTLAKLIVGLYVPDAGETRLDGRTVDPGREDYRRLFSVVFDDSAVFETLWGLSGPDLDRRATDLLRRMQLDPVVQVRDGVFSTTQLSRGQRKRLALVTALLEDRPIYVFDEWAAEQDPVFRKAFYLELLPELKRMGKTVVAITHDDRYFAAADRLLKLEEGQCRDR